MSKDNSKEIRITFRFYETSDILRFEKFKKEINSKDETVSNAVADIVRNYLLEREKKVVMREVRDDFYYSLRKVFYSSLAPFSANIIREILKNRIEDTIIGKKIDVMLNSLVNNLKITKNDLDNLNSKMLEEPKFFENLREIFKAENKNKIQKVNKKVAEVKEQQKVFDEYEKNVSDWDAEIVSQTYENFDFDAFQIDENLDELGEQKNEKETKK